jgi:hypothetical protein
MRSRFWLPPTCVRDPCARAAPVSARDGVSAGSRPKTMVVHAEEQREPRHLPVERDAFGPRQSIRNHAAQELRTPDRKQQSAKRPRQSNQKSLPQQLAHDLAAAGAQRDADGHFAGAPVALGEQQAGHVCATDQEHHAHGRKQNPQALARAAHSGFLQRTDDRFPMCIGGGIL